VGFGLTYDIVLTARGFHPLKVSASEHRAVAKGAKGESKLGLDPGFATFIKNFPDSDY